MTICSAYSEIRFKISVAEGPKHGGSLLGALTRGPCLQGSLLLPPPDTLHCALRVESLDILLQSFSVVLQRALLCREARMLGVTIRHPHPQLPDFGKMTAFVYAGTSVGQSQVMSLLTGVSVATWSPRHAQGFSLSFGQAVVPARDLRYLHHFWPQDYNHSGSQLSFLLHTEAVMGKSTRLAGPD